MPRTGIAELPELPWGSHLFLVHCGAADAADIWVPYLKEGLLSGDKCVALVDGNLREYVRQRLARDNEIPSNLLETALTWDSAIPYNPHKTAPDEPIKALEKLCRLTDDGKFRGLRVAGEALWGPHASEECLIDVCCPFERSMWMCSYHVKFLPLLSDMAHVSATHSAGVVRLGASAARHVVRRAAPFPTPDCVALLPCAGCQPPDSKLARLAASLCIAAGAAAASFASRGRTDRDFAWRDPAAAGELAAAERREVFVQPPGVVEVAWAAGAGGDGDDNEARARRAALADRLCTVVATWLSMHVEEEGAPQSCSTTVLPVATVVSAEFAGFDELAESMDGADVVKALHTLLARWAVEGERLRLTTVASGPHMVRVVGAPALPGGDDRHTDSCVRYVKTMLESVREYNAEHGTTVAVRAGIARGPVTMSKPCSTAELCAWGPAATASRRLMRGTGENTCAVARKTADTVEDAGLAELLRGAFVQSALDAVVLSDLGLTATAD
eukprot:m51a1_g1154 hypothetical protein (501) ;mRNA; f:304098-305794